MKKKNKLKKSIRKKTPFIMMILFIIIIVVFLKNMEIECYEAEETCYKTECSFWGCRKIEVDVGSPQCEIKREDCVSGYISVFGS